MKTLNNYVGHIVRLTPSAFREVARHATSRGSSPENRFLVAETRSAQRKLICYGGSLRIAVGASDVALI